MLDALTFTDVPTLSRAIRTPGTWRDETLAAARNIADRSKKPLWVAFSGGIDSEILCRSFYEQNITFSTITALHSDGANAEDAAYAKKWCWDRGIPHEQIPLDTAAFIRDAPTRYSGFPSHNLFHYFQMYLMERIEERNGVGVIGDGGLLLYADRSRDSVALKFTQSDQGVQAWTTEREAKHVSSFFRSTPELLLSMLTHPLVRATENDPSLFHNDRNRFLFKRFMFQALFPGLPERPKRPMFGHFADLRRKIESELKQRYPALQQWFIPVHEAVDSLTPRQ